MTTTPALPDASSAAHFSQTYAQARERFLAAAAAAGLKVASHPHPLPGHDGEELALDVVRDGPADAPALLIISSACHGVEGYCGSGVQVALLQDTAWGAQVRASGVAVLYLHGLNPHGFSWWRRTTHENVDLNRNFVDFAQALPANPAYDELAQAIVPADWPPPEEAQRTLAAYAAVHGERGLRGAIANGQHGHPDGLFFAGKAPTWSHLRVREVLREHGRACSRLAWIDLHTGLGPSGHGEPIFTGRPSKPAVERARSWWGPEVTSALDGSSVSTDVQGTISQAAHDECPQAEFTGMALEYGTLPPDQVIDALRADQWMQNHPDRVDTATRQRIRQRLRDVFYIDTDEWKATVVTQGRQRAQQALAGLSRQA